MTVDAGAAASQGAGNGAGSGVAEKPTWIEQLPEAMRTDESLYTYKTIGDLVTGYKGTIAERDSRIQVPGEGATDEVRASFRKAIGVPEAPDKYTIGKPADLPEAIPYNPEVEQEMRKLFHDEGVSDKAAATIWNRYYSMVKQGFERQNNDLKKSQDEALTTLKNEWGNDFDTKAELAKRAFKTFGGKDFESLLTEKIGATVLGDHPGFLKLFAEIGKRVMDDSGNVIGEKGGSMDNTPEAVKERAAKEMFPSMQK